MQKAILIGATGLIGSNCLNILLNDPSYSHVEIWVRKKNGIVHPKLVEKIIDFSQLHNQVSENTKHVYCCLGSTINKAKTKEAYRLVDVTYVLELAKWCEKNNIESFSVISSIGASKYASSYYLKMKGDMEENVKLCNIPSISIFRPSLLLGERTEFRLLEKASIGLYKLFKFIFIGSLSKYKGIEASVVANALVKTAKETKPGITVYESEQIQLIGG